MKTEITIEELDLLFARADSKSNAIILLKAVCT